SVLRYHRVRPSPSLTAVFLRLSQAPRSPHPNAKTHRGKQPLAAASRTVAMVDVEH
uniref:Uncharacterized protein n=1 Tax=Aegilops tauschii subsp. strangulata TaxID=200361 RepID=A0A453KZ01_AEGTS